MTNLHPFSRLAVTVEPMGEAGSVPAAPPNGETSLRQKPARTKRLLVSFGVSIAIAGSALVTASPASAAPPCGLSYSGPVFGKYTYTIRNCHSYGVWRKLDLRKLIVGYPDGPCHYIPAYSSVRDWTSLPDGVYIAGIKPC